MAKKQKAQIGEQVYIMETGVLCEVVDVKRDTNFKGNVFRYTLKQVKSGETTWRNDNQIVKADKAVFVVVSHQTDSHDVDYLHVEGMSKSLDKAKEILQRCLKQFWDDVDGMEEHYKTITDSPNKVQISGWEDYNNDHYYVEIKVGEMG